MLIDTSNKTVKKGMNRLVSEFKYQGPPKVPTSPRPGSPSAKGGSKNTQRKGLSMNEEKQRK